MAASCVQGDGPLARRTEVRNANDRYANLETNYLLQRLEQYEGIAVVTTNAGENIDPAFKRRMDVVVSFPLPQAEERRQLWELHLPPAHALDPTSSRTSRAAARSPAARSATPHCWRISWRSTRTRCASRASICRAAIEAEYRKAGAVCPLASGSRPGPKTRKVASFLANLAASGPEGA